MPLKLKEHGPTYPNDFTSMAGAFVHFIRTWYEEPENPVDVQEIRHAFYAGAIYMKSLVHQASKLTPAEAQTHIGRLYKELIDEAARNAAAPWLPKREDTLTATAPKKVPQAPQPPAAPGATDPERHMVISNTPTQPPPQPSGQAQDGSEQKPMMWTLHMVREFEAAFTGAHNAGAQTFPFRGHTFRTVDAPTIISHLKNVFANDLSKPQPPQPPQQ